MAMPTTIAPTIKTTMLLEKLEKTSSKEQTPRRTIITQPRQAVTEFGTHSVKKSTTQTARIIKPITAEDIVYSPFSLWEGRLGNTEPFKYIVPPSCGHSRWVMLR